MHPYFLNLIVCVLNKGIGLDSPSRRVGYRLRTLLTSLSKPFHDAMAVNTHFRDALNKHQKSYAVIEGITDIFRDDARIFPPLCPSCSVST
jgi:lambda repressor-like predicted transcriptional regulator